MLLPFKDHHNNLSIPVMLPCQTNPLQVSKPSQPYNFDSIVPSELSLWYTHLVLSIQITSSGGKITLTPPLLTSPNCTSQQASLFSLHWAKINWLVLPICFGLSFQCFTFQIHSILQTLICFGLNYNCIRNHLLQLVGSLEGDEWIWCMLQNLRVTSTLTRSFRKRIYT